MPESPDLERAVLGALLLEGSRTADVRGIVSPEAFADPANRRIYDTALSLDDRGTAIDVASVAGALRQTEGTPVKVSYLAALSGAVGSGVNCTTYARQLQDTYTRRRMVIFSYELAGRAVSDPEGVVEWASQQLAAIADGAAPSDGLRPIGEISGITLRALEARQRAYREGRTVGVTTGLHRLDEVTGGWRGGQLIVLAGRPGMGKSAAALHFMTSAARAGVPVCFFSLEMQATQLVDRMLIGESATDAGAYRAGRIDTAAWEEIERAHAYLSGLPVHICDRPALSMAQVRTQCRRMHRRGMCGMVVIDYLQLLDVEERTQNREREVAAMSRAAKQLAKELDVPVVILAQLSRAVEQRADKVPLLSDLRESGAIEQDADAVIFIVRPEYYGFQTVETSRYGTIPAHGVGRFIIAKQRDGCTGSVYFRLNESVTRLSDFDEPAPGEAF